MSRNAFAQCERDYNEAEAQRERAAYERKAMRTVTGKVDAYITEYSSLSPQELMTLDGDELASRIYYFTEGSPAITGWSKVGTAEIILHIDDADELIDSKVESLEAEITKTRADAEARCTQLRGQIQNLLAITHKE